MNRQMPSKGRDPITYNKAINNVRRAKAFRKTVEGNRVEEAIADLVVLILQESVKPTTFTRGGFIYGGRKEEWVLRA